MSQTETGARAVEADGAARQRSGHGRLKGASRKAQDRPHETVAFHRAPPVSGAFDHQARGVRRLRKGNGSCTAYDRMTKIARLLFGVGHWHLSER